MKRRSYVALAVVAAIWPGLAFGQCVVDKRPSNGAASLVTMPVAGQTKGIVEDPSGMLWAGASSTVYKFNAAGTQLLTLSPGASVNDIAIDSGGLVWVAAGASAKRYTTGGSLQTTLSESATVAVLAADRSNPVLWIAAGSTASKFNLTGTRLASFNAGAAVTALMIRSDGTVWVGAGATVSKLSAGGTLLASFAAGTTVADIAEDSAGNVWVAAGTSVNKYSAAASGTVLATASLTSTVTDIDIDAAGPLWVAAGNEARKFALDGSPLVTISENDPVSAVGASASGPVWIGVCRTPHISVGPGSLSFGSLAAGASQTLPLTIQNTGAANLSFSVSSTNSMYSTSPATGSVPPGGTQTVNVTFSPPVATPSGTQTGALNITHNDPNQASPKAISATASVTAVAQLGVTTSTLTFGNVVQGASKTLSFMIHNGGGATLTFSISSTNGMYSVSPASGSVPSSGNQTINVTFSPPAATPPGTQVGTLNITHNDSNQASPKSVSLTANVVAAVPQLTLSTSTLDFGAIVEGTSKTLSFNIQNSGTAPLTVSVSSTSAMYSASPSSASVPPSSTQVINVTFAPAAGTPPGTQPAILNITHNDPNQASPKPVNATGNVLAAVPQLRLSVSSLNFGAVIEGTSKAVQLDIQNTGTAALTMSITSNSTMYSASPSTASIPPGGTETINVTFAPPIGTSPGAQTARLDVGHNDPNQPSPRTVSLTAAVISASAPPAPRNIEIR